MNEDPKKPPDDAFDVEFEEDDESDLIDPSELSDAARKKIEDEEGN